jgi:PAS domain S-box-containing protein
MDSQINTNSAPNDKNTAHEEQIRSAQRIAEDLRKSLNQAQTEAAKFRLLFEHAADGILVVDCQTYRFILANQNICRMLGYSQEEILGLSLQDIHPVAVSDQVRELFDGMLRGEINHSLTGCPLLRKDGGIFHADISSALLTLDSKPAAIGFFHDVSERSRAQEQLWIREAELAGIFRTAPIGIGLMIDRVFSKVNQRFCEMVGYTEEELIGRDSRMLYPAQEDYDYVGREKYNQIRDKGAGIIESRWLTKDGRILNILLSLTPLDAGDWSKGITFTALDITERNQIQIALAQSEQRFRQMFEWMSSASVIYQPVDEGQDFLIADLNPSVERIEKRRKKEIVGRRVTEVFPGVETFGLLEIFRRVYRTGRPAHHPVSIYRDQRIRGWRENYVYKLPSGEIVALYEDVTEKKQAEHAREKLLKELRAKNEELESIVFIASHDLRSPLVNIEGFTGEISKSCRELSALFKQTSCDKEIRQRLERLLENEIPESIRFVAAGTTKMDALLSGLLRLSRIGTATMHIEPVQMNLLIQTILGAMRFEVQRLGAQIQIEELPNCLGDAVRINQVFTNLIDNAIKYRHPDRPIQIRIAGTVNGDEAVYTVSDNGIGIDRAHYEKIFEIFHQLNPNSPSGGQGLGLTIVRRILDRLDGQIRVESEIGIGSTFLIALPRSDKELSSEKNP